MNILMISRATLFSSPGGDTIQILETAQSLRSLGVTLDIKLANERVQYSNYDLIHFFNIIRPNDIFRHIRKSKLPYVVSTIYVDYTEAEKRNRKGIFKLLSLVFSGDQLEYLKTIARWVLNGESIGDPTYLLLGHKRSVRKVIMNACLLLPNSKSEYDRLLIRYNQPQQFIIVPNGINANKFNVNQKELGDTDRTYVLCIARIENRKNQLMLIRALNGTKYRLVLIGKPSPNHTKYYEQCKRSASSNITFIDHMSQDELIAYYKKAKVHVLPSWFETTGLSSLEAAVMGCNIVVTAKGDTVEYFGNLAYYCDPSDEKSIFQAVEEAYQQPFKLKLKEKILQEYTWEEAAQQTLNAYNKVLGELKAV